MKATPEDRACGGAAAGAWMRLFIAVEAAQQVRDALSAAQDALRKAGADIRWVDPGRMHLTLVFLGDVEAVRAPELEPALDACCASVVAFEMEAAGLGFFGRADAPRVIWAGIGDGSAAVSALQAQIRAAVLALGFKLEDRAFSAHLTLGRSRSARNGAALARALALNSKAFGRTLVERALLMRSELTPAGPVYSILHEARLKARA